jgi:inward rectifier potassium channel
VKSRKNIIEEEVKNLGLGSKENPTGKRIINHDGSFNIIKKGIPFLESFNFYHYLVTISWPKFILIVFSGYLVLNAVFGMIFYLIGVDHLMGVIATSETDKYLEAFFFSAQSFTTVGYGRISPVGFWTSTIAALESLTGLLGLALATGLLYGRFSRPIARILHSKNAIIAPFKDVNALQFRAANKQKSQMIDVEVTVMLSIIQNQNGTNIRKFYNLSLEYKKINFFPTIWTVNHIIDENSPFYGLGDQDLLNGEAEIMILLKGFDDTFSQNVHTRFSYKADEIIWGARFVNVFGIEEDGTGTVELDKIGEYEKSSLSSNSSLSP